MSQNHNPIWSKWMLVISTLVFILGLCFAFIFPYLLPQVIEPYFIEIAGMQFSDLTHVEILHLNLLYGVVGSVILGWGTVLLLMSYRSLKQPSDWIWTSMVISLIIWFISDTLASIMVGSSINVLLNTSLLVLAAPPLIANRKNIINGMKNLSQQ